VKAHILQDEEYPIPLSLTKKTSNFCYITKGDIMRVKIFDENHEKDLEESINEFLEEENELIDIHYSVAVTMFGDEQVYCYSAMIVYR
jgi:hypothetical protein